MGPNQKVALGTIDPKRLFPCSSCDVKFSRNDSLQRHLERFPLHKENQMAMVSEPSPRTKEGTSLFVKHLEKMPLSEEPWNCCRWNGEQADESASVLKALSRGQPIFWENGAKHSNGLQLPVLPDDDFIKQVEFLLQHVANPAAKLVTKSMRLPPEQQV